MGKQNIVIKTNEENPEPTEIIAKAIIQVSEGIEIMNKSRLTRRAIALLIKDSLPSSAKLGLNDINLILNSAAELKDVYIKKPKP